MDEKLGTSGIVHGFGDDVVLNEISFSVHTGETLLVSGRSGSGKSTLLEICAGLIRPRRGTVRWDGRALGRDIGRDREVRLRQKIGYLFQTHALIHNYPVFESIALPLRYHTDLSDKEVRSRVGRELEVLGIARIAGKLPDQLSISEARYASLARSLILEPALLFLDEPIGGMDPYACEKLVMILKTLQSEKRTTMVIACNSPHAFAAMDCTVKVLDGGELYGAAFREEHVMAGAHDLDLVIRETQ